MKTSRLLKIGLIAAALAVVITAPGPGDTGWSPPSSHHVYTA